MTFFISGFATWFFWGVVPIFFSALMAALTLACVPDLLKAQAQKEIIARFGGMQWERDVFCRGWSITGSTGSGKTAAAIKYLAHELFKNAPNWGGIIIDPKCVLWQDFREISRHYSREDDFCNIQVRNPAIHQPEWKPAKTFNLLAYPGMPYSAKAKILVDTAASVKGKKETDFFDLQAQNHITQALYALDASGLPVTMRQLYKVLILEDETIKMVESLKIQAKTQAWNHIKKHYADVHEKYIKVAKALKEHHCNPDSDIPNEERLAVETFDKCPTEDWPLILFEDEVILGVLPTDEEIPKAWDLAVHFVKNYLTLSTEAGEQFQGIRGSIENVVNFFNEDAIAEVFASSNPNTNVDFRDIDTGKFLCFSIPQIYSAARDFIFTFCKLLYYQHALNRFDLPKKLWSKYNLLVFFADEAQAVVTAAEDGMADYNVIDKIREARATVVFATQSTTSYLPKLKDVNKVKVLLLNLKNQFYFQLADMDAAKIAADVIGGRRIKKASATYNRLGMRTSTQAQEKDEHWITPFELMQLQPFVAVLKHAQGGFARLLMPPLDDKGEISERYLNEKFA